MSEIVRFYAEMIEMIESRPEAPFYRYDKDVRSYVDFKEGLLRAVKRLSNRPKSRVAILAGKGFETYTAIFSVVLGGHTWIPISPQMPADRICGVLEVGEPVVLISDQALPEAILEACNRLGIEVLPLVDLFAGSANDSLSVPEVEPGDWAMIYFTSGSTGRPKGVPITHESYIINVRNIIRLLPFGENEAFGDYHDLGFVISIPVLFPCVMIGGAIVPGLTQAEQFLPMGSLQKNDVSVLITVPSTLARIMRAPSGTVEMPRMNVIISCGEPLALDVLEYCLEEMRPGTLFNFYGSTEVAPWIFCHECRLSDVETFSDIGAAPIGLPIEGNSVMFSDENELFVTGPQITPGYLGGHDDSTFPIIDGVRWYKTGDKVVEKHGVYVCKGRLDSQVKIEGYRVDLMDIEANLRTLDGVEQAFCFSFERDGRPQIAAALFGGKQYSQIEVLAFLKKRLPRYMIPRVCRHFTEIPYNKSGKLDRVRVKEAFEGGI